ncbi:MAG: hypothetical protein AAF581_05935 [Planctomycetota bacterium]
MRISIGVALIVVTAVLAAAVASGCQRFSVNHKHATAGFNGSYEVAEAGLPVNWNLHAPPLQSGSYKVSLDATHRVDGAQSLKLTAMRVDAGGGWRTPGFFQLRPAAENQRYKVSFHLRNEGASASLLITSEKPKVMPKPLRVQLTPAETGTGEWRLFEYTYTVPASYDNLRFELTMTQPGTVWIDDVRVEEISH